MTPELLSLLSYNNPKVLEVFCSQHPEISVDEAQVVFQDLLAWMWLSVQRANLGKKTYLFGPLLLLDEMWHVFILHTQDYVDFSMCYFGMYFHHEVESVGFEHVVTEEELTDFLNDCFNFLNNQWVERRFSNALF